MDKLVSIFLLSCAIFETVSASPCNLWHHTVVYRKFNYIKGVTVCQGLNLARDSLERLMFACGSGLRSLEHLETTCSESEKAEGCSIFDDSVSVPMSDKSNHKSLCSVYYGLKACQENKCVQGTEMAGHKTDGSNTDEPKTGDEDRECGDWIPEPAARFIYCSYVVDITEEDGTSCPANAFKKCVDPVKDVRDVTGESCEQVAKAKTCYLDELSDCSGSSHHKFAADVLIRGLEHHVEQCEKNGIGFSEDEDKECGHWILEPYARNLYCGYVVDTEAGEEEEEKEKDEIQISGSNNVDAGDRIILQCNYTNIDQPKEVNWIRNGTILRTEPVTGIIIRKSASVTTGTFQNSLEIKHARLVDAGTYLCRTSNGAVKSIQINVLENEDKECGHWIPEPYARNLYCGYVVDTEAGEEEEEKETDVASSTPGLLTTLTTQTPLPLPTTSTRNNKQGWRARKDARKNAETEFFQTQIELNKIRKEVELRKRVQLDLEFLEIKLKWGLVSPRDVPRLGGEIMSQLAQSNSTASA